MSDETPKKRPLREAVALEYGKAMVAPKVIAAGRGQAAENIIKKAEELSIPIHADAELAHTLNMLQIGDEIPAELYTVVAQVLLYVKDVDNNASRDKKWYDK